LSKSQSILAWKAGSICGMIEGGVHLRRGFEGVFREEGLAVETAEALRPQIRRVEMMTETSMLTRRKCKDWVVLMWLNESYLRTTPKLL
jgi:hypothetical protein